MTIKIITVIGLLILTIATYSLAQQSDAIQEKFKQAEQLKVLQQKTNQPTAVLPQGKQAEQPNQPSADQKTVSETPPPAQIMTTTIQPPTQPTTTINNAQESPEGSTKQPTQQLVNSDQLGSSTVTNKTAIFEDSQWIIVEARNAGNMLKSIDMLEEEARTDGKFIIVCFKVKNTTKQEDRILDTPKIVDSQGREFSDYDDQAFYVPETAKNLAMEALPPGIQKEFWGIYEVPADATGLKFQARALSIDGDKKLLDLGL